MPSAYDCFPPHSAHIHRLASRISPAIHSICSHIVRLAAADPRVAATATLLGVMMCAVVAFALSPPPAATVEKMTANRSSKADDARAGSVRIIGATPRENCEEQVWPYIERRCRRRAADKPEANSVQVVAAPHASQQVTQTSRAETIGAAPGNGTASVQSSVPNNAAESQILTTNAPWPHPRPQIEAMAEPGSLPIPPGAVPIPPGEGSRERLSSWHDMGNAWIGRAVERPVIGEPRRRAGRGANRGGYGRIGGRGHVFALPLGFRF